MKFIPVRGRKHPILGIVDAVIELKFIPVRGRKPFYVAGAFNVSVQLKFNPERGRKLQRVNNFI